MDGITAAGNSISQYQRILDVANNAIAEGVITPEVVSAQELAEAQIEAQTEVFKDALEIEKATILNLIA